MTENTREPDVDLQPTKAASDADSPDAEAVFDAPTVRGDFMPPTVRHEATAEPTGSENARFGVGPRTNLVPKHPSSAPPVAPTESASSPGEAPAPTEGTSPATDDTVDIGPSKPLLAPTERAGVVARADVMPGSHRAADNGAADDDFDGRPTRTYGLAAPDLETPVATAALPIDALPTHPLPTAALPTDPLPTDPLPTAALPTDPLPTDPLPTAALPTDPLPTAALPTDPLPTAALPTDPLPESAAAGAEPLDAGALMDEPPLEEDGEPFVPLPDGSINGDRVRLLTADDTATALRLLHSRALEMGSGAADSANEAPAHSASIEEPETGSDEPASSSECLTARGDASTSAQDTVGAVPSAAAPSAAAPDEPTVPSLRESQELVAILPSKAPAFGHPPTDHSPLGAHAAARPQRPGGARRLAWGGTAVALTVFTAWWFTSPLDSPPSESSSELGTDAGAVSSRDAPAQATRDMNRSPIPDQSAVPPSPPSASGRDPAASSSQAALSPGESTRDLSAPNSAQQGPLPAAGSDVPVVAPEVSGSPSETDKELARAALRDAARAAGRCRFQGDPSGWTRVTVTFESSGQASSAKILKEPFKDTNTAACIEAKMKRLTIPPFGGGPMTITHPVEVF